MKPPKNDHPIYPILRLAVVMFAMFATLELVASDFDETEIIALVVLFIVASSTEGVSSLIGYLAKKYEIKKRDDDES